MSHLIHFVPFDTFISTQKCVATQNLVSWQKQ